MLRSAPRCSRLLRAYSTVQYGGVRAVMRAVSVKRSGGSWDRWVSLSARTALRDGEPAAALIKNGTHLQKVILNS